ncbi:endolytic transglycosylase MltG [Lyngbya confervoides]|uniref:Endolytic murein transglycosylase n=1 Tax=Lyngbya confervoides BDU141951 TaxID=1574623 RepID=A0ABD4SYJ1_9CYAN|nr:endolytic transglycosylase MltG [Lyngbya confervoides]MCM1981364.1 endolytic transglycosylase MltG [Lyngbya confervoides BDU141951]
MTRNLQPNPKSKRSPRSQSLQPRRPRKPSSRRIWAPVLGLTVLLGGAYGCSQAWWRSQTRPVLVQGASRAEAANIQVQIPSGTSANEVGQILQDKNLIHSLLAWKIWTRWAGLTNRPGGFQAGTYELSPGDPLPNLAETIWEGRVKEAVFTIPEGWSMRQMAQYFEAQGWFSQDEFRAVAEQILANPPQWLPPQLESLEGFLFPDTYQVPVDSRTPEAVLATMLKRFETTALPLYEAASPPPSLTLQEWVTFASIVEKESVVPQERPIIAGVFKNRLEIGMTLGSDPTVEYGLGVTQTPENPLTLAQVRTPSPYNTYINPGLTPTPIASPGLASLEVSLNPAQTEYLYFVARYDGTHVFSKTLAEHERAQAKIRDKFDPKS